MSAKTIWLCGACGRSARKRLEFQDESCLLNSVEVYVDSILRDAEGKLIKAEAVNPAIERA